MINVEITPFAKNLMTAYIGAIAYQQNVLKANAQAIQKDQNRIIQANEELEKWSELSFDLTTSMIDKRFKGSKDFISSRGQSGSKVFKKTLTDEERHLQIVLEKNMIKAQTRYSSAVTLFNQRNNERKIRASSKRIDLRAFL